MNEGEQEIDGILSLPGVQGVEVWDPLTGKAWQAPCAAAPGGCQVALRLERRQGLVLTWDGNPTAAGVAGRETEPVPVASAACSGECVLTLATGWQVFDQDGAEVSVPAPGDWAQVPRQELFAGTRVCRTDFVLAETSADAIAAVDLGQVGDIAEVALNGVPLGVRAWAPYRFMVRGCLRAGTNHLEVRVTNSFANVAYGRQLPSGLLGPVRLLACGVR